MAFTHECHRTARTLPPAIWLNRQWRLFDSACIGRLTQVRHHISVTEDIITMRPSLRLIISGRTALVTFQTPLILISKMWKSRSSSLISGNCPDGTRQRYSQNIRFYLQSLWRAQPPPAPKSKSLTSALTAVQRCPRPPSSSASFSISWGIQQIKFAPWRAMPEQVASPMPCDAPVINAVLPMMSLPISMSRFEYRSYTPLTLKMQ